MYSTTIVFTIISTKTSHFYYLPILLIQQNDMRYQLILFEFKLLLIDMVKRVSHLFGEILLYQPTANRMVEILVFLKSFHSNLTVKVSKGTEPVFHN